ncbi:protein O-linked-mannose beta-1,2-N-acetylglucosaminyltransferase 1-like [Penaeus chinensis]|uniref:protein O-linked-mannose beta-1,2-N-acetylglucosaminyltransferase 1-like n=1 Tax=Penaeus chinensis TaxID=139456 RepID=UPI001FB5AAC5|nr:protein O-linked-mannose beta-1,2-N-acetylglucosaminyltransferase 1-like [Penaeus chinensis]
MRDKSCASELRRRPIQACLYIVVLFSASTESLTRNAGLTTWSSRRGSSLDIDRCDGLQLQRHSRCEDDRSVKEVWSPSQENHESRPQSSPTEGITLTVLNQRTAALIFTKVFPLGYYWAHYADLQWHLDRVAPGRILVLTVAVSGTVGLRQAAHQLARLGSLFALHLTPMAHWTWVFVKGGRTISETVILQGLAQHQAHLILPLSDLPTPTTPSNQTLQQQRWHYCHRHAAMGGLCDEHTPDPLPPPSPPTLPHQSALADVPVVVTAGARHHYLYHTLNTLLTAPGAQRNNVLVVLGDAPQPTTQLLRLINVNFTKVPVHGEGNLKLFRYYRSVFQLVARTFPDAPAVIFLDEDVEVSPDFFSFMSQTLWLLREDPTLYCINGFSATGFFGVAHDNSRILRAKSQVEWGYALSSKFIKEAVMRWPQNNSGDNIVHYDHWLYKHASQGRECAFPEVSRTLHYGIGVNSNAFTTERYFLSMPIVKSWNIKIHNVVGLRLPQWQQNFIHNISHAIPVIGNPCQPSFVPSTNTSKNYVFYYNMTKKSDGKPDYKNFFFIASCLGAWALSDQGQHDTVLTVRLSMMATLYMVGAPFSPYAHLRPPHVIPWDVDLISDEQEDILVNRIRELELGKYHIKNLNITHNTLMNLMSIESSTT